MENQSYHQITIDLSRDSLLSEQSLKLLQDYYMVEGESSPQEAFARASLAYCYGDYGLAQRIYDYVSQGWFMFASPVLSNAPVPGAHPKALPISCFLSFVPDTLPGLIDHQSELEWLSVKGGGVGGHWSEVRAVSDKSPGPIPFIKVADSAMTAYKQGKTRKGSYAAYLDVSHPDVVEFLNIRVPTGGDSNRKAFNIHNALNIPDAFMVAVINDLDWYLVDPASQKVTETIKARELWQRILETRFRTGEPYLNFIDTANAHLNVFQKAAGMTIKGSNLCNEIHLVTDADRTAVCCLSSVNLEKYEEWNGTNMVRDLTRFLDNVLQFFIDHCPLELDKARFSAEMERSIGIGMMGFHSYLQANNIPWETPMAKGLNRAVSRYIKGEAVAESMELAAERGEPDDLIGSGMRNAHLLAVAPNANSSIIVGCSPSIEPWKSNAYTHRTRIGSHLIKNKHLQKVLVKYGRDDDETWQSIILHDGSVQHLEFLTEWEKDVFKTFFEIDQRWVVEHAADRQEYVCQGQSVNVAFPAGANKSYVNEVHLLAWKRGLKGLYYLRTSAGKTAEKVSQHVARVALSDLIGSNEECVACQG